MEHTKPNFKALRETLGVSQRLLADILHVDVRSVKRWESPTNTWEAPQDAWRVLEGFLERQEWMIDTTLDKVDDIEGAMGASRAVSLTYWLNEDEYEAAHPGEGKYWQTANATSRIVAAILRGEGREVNFDFPGLKAISGDI